MTDATSRVVSTAPCMFLCATARGAPPVETAKTPIGDIQLQFGFPATPAEERRIYDEIDFQRADRGILQADLRVARLRGNCALSQRLLRRN